MTARKLFLPGAGGSADFWRPVMDRLPAAWDMHSFAWPGLGNEPHDPAVNGLDDLVSLVLDHIIEPVDIVAQSMGCLVALKATLRAPEKVYNLVLAGTSGGIPDAWLEGADEWRSDYRREYPGAQTWITETREDLSAQLKNLSVLTLLLWGEDDPISPLRAGRALQALLPNSDLAVVHGGGHDFPLTHAKETAEAIERYWWRGQIPSTCFAAAICSRTRVGAVPP